MNDAWSVAKEIADFRAGNGLARATPKEALHDIEEATCQRLHDDPEYCVKKKKNAVRAAIDHQFASAKAAVGVGRKILVDWLGDGARPVPINLAQKRADVCIECPENRNGHSWLKLTADTVRAIAEQMNAKSNLKLRVNGEEKLHACAVCYCPLPLKVHVPLATILAQIEDTAAFPPWCWLVTERNNL